MMLDVKNRWTQKVQFTAKINCDQTESRSVKLGFAVLWAIKSGANLRGANLRGADLSDADLSDADLRGAYLSGANLSGANLRSAKLSGVKLSGAYLRGANLSGAYLSDADLSDADLSGADLSDADLSGAYLSDADLSGAYLSDADLSGAYLSGADIIHCGARSDGYEFYAQVKDEVLWIIAGSRYFTHEDAISHWQKTRASTQLGDESLALLDNAKRLAEIRGLI